MMKGTNLGGATATPEWLRVSENDEEVPANSSGQSRTSNNTNLESSTFGSKLSINTQSPTSMMFWALKVITILLCILMFATSIIGIYE